MTQRGETLDCDSGDVKAFGETLAARRRSLLVSQAQLAQLANVSQAFISQIESGRRNCNLRTLVAIVGAMKCELSIQLTEQTAALPAIVEATVGSPVTTSHWGHVRGQQRVRTDPAVVRLKREILEILQSDGGDST